MSKAITERVGHIHYIAALVGAVLRHGADHTASDADLDRIAAAAGLRPPAGAETRAAVRAAIEEPVDFMDNCSQDATQALFDAAAEGRVLLVVGAQRCRTVMVPQQVHEATDTLSLPNLRAQVSAAAWRVTQNPDASDPEWRAALDELGRALELARQVDPAFPADKAAPGENLDDCTCIEFCDEDPASACTLSGVPHVHPDDPKRPGAYGPCPVHPERPGDR